MPVALAARRADKLRAAVDAIVAAGGRAIAVEADVTSPDDCRRLIDRAAGAFGPLHAVFANAGYGLEKPVAATTDAEVRAIFETNFFGTLNTIGAALPAMLDARRGHILVCSSCLSKIGVPYVGVYSATKAAQDHVARALRIELDGTGVYVSSVHPVRTRTEFFDRSASRSGRERIALATPSWVDQPPERVAAAVVRCLRRPRPEVWTSATTRVIFSLLNMFPRVGDAALRGYARRAASSTTA